MRCRITWRGATQLLLAAALLSCDGSDDGGGGTTGPTASIQVALSPASLTVQQGATGSTTVSLTRTNFTGAVALALDAPPAGITGTFTPASVTGDNASLSVSVVNTAVASSYTLTIRATGSGIAAQTASLALTVTATPAIAVSAVPSAITVLAGGATVSTTLTYSRTNFTGPITIAHVQGLPSGIVVSDPTGPTSGTTGVLSFDATAAAAPGTYNTVWEATGTGALPGRVTIVITVTAPTGSITLSANPAALSAVAGGAPVTSIITIARTTFTGDVTFTGQLGVPAGSFSFSPTSTSGNTTTMTITVSAASAPGTYAVTITGSGTGIAPASTQIQVTVTAPPASSIAIAITPSSTSVVQNGGGEAFVNITRTNFSGPVTLGVASAPAGVFIAFDQSPTTLNQVRLTFTANVTAAVGTHTITITAQGANVATANATFSLQVIAAGSSQVEFQFCSTSENPLFFAARDGSGAWQVVTGTFLTGVYRYRFPLSQGTGGVFFVQQRGSAIIAGSASSTLGSLLRPVRLATSIVPDALARLNPNALPQAATATSYETTVLFATATELAAIGLDNCSASQPTKTTWLQVTGVGNGQQATLSLGGDTQVFDGTVGLSPVQFTGVRSGVIDFFGTRESSLTGVPGRILDVRGLNPADGSTLPFTADFNSANAYDPASALLTIGNALGDDLLNFASFTTANGEAGLLGGVQAPSTATTRTWYGVPTAKLQSGDLHANMIFASPAVTTVAEQRYQFVFTTAVQNLMATLGPRLPTPTATSVGTPAYRRVRVQGSLPLEYNDLVIALYEPSGGGNEVSLAATGGYLTAIGSAAGYDLSTPDVSSLPGFPIASVPPAGLWEVMVNVNGWSGAGTLTPAPANGATLLGAAKQVGLTVP